MAYAIAEMEQTATVGFAPRGVAAELWRYQGPAILISGPAETGKTWACLQKLDALMWKYPGATAAIIRKTYQSMVGSVIQTYKRILGKDTPVKAYGGERPQWFDYPNGSRVYVGGMDNPQKVLSSERDFIYINQAEELEGGDYQTLRTRNTGRGAGIAPYAQTFGDCNPGPPNHWIIQQAKAGNLKLLYSRHEDNPTLFDDAGEILEQGRRTMAVLDGLSGVFKERLRFGKWVAAEGQVYDKFDPAIHQISHVPGHPEWTRANLPRHWRRFRGIDFGFTNPFVCQWWAMDDDGRIYRYRELYGTQTLVEDWAAQITLCEVDPEKYAELKKKFLEAHPDLDKEGENDKQFASWLRNNYEEELEQIEFSVADHDAEDRATLERYGIWTFPADKEVSPGIQDVQARLKKAGDGKPRIFFMRDALVQVDYRLEEAKKPTCTEEEFPGYVWAKSPGGVATKEQPTKQDDHGLDTTRYVVHHLDSVPEPQNYSQGFD